MARGGTGNPFLPGSSFCFLWISLTFHTGPDGCLQTDFCKRALPCRPVGAQTSVPTRSSACRETSSSKEEFARALASLGATFGPWGHRIQAGRSQSGCWQQQEAVPSFIGPGLNSPPRAERERVRSLNLT